MNNYCGARFRDFIYELESAMRDDGSSESALLPAVGDGMKRLIAMDDWLPDIYAQPHPKYYQQYLLHADPKGKYSVVSFVWGPGQFTPVHDHLVWGVIGVLRGGELVESYDVAELHNVRQRGAVERMRVGDIAFVSPKIGDVHRVRNEFDDRVSVSIHVYGGDIGMINRHVYNLSGEPRKSFVSGYANVQEGKTKPSSSI